MAFGDNGLVKYAEQARDYVTNDVEYIDDSFVNSEQYIDSVIYKNKWRYDNDGNITNGSITLKIGDYINYDCTSNDEIYTSLSTSNGYEDQTFKPSEYSYGWRVLGVDETKGRLLIRSEDLVPLIGGHSENNRSYFVLKGKEGYTNGVEELNKICSIYGKGKGATRGRCLTVEEVNKLLGYNPNNIGVYDPRQEGVGLKHEQGTISEYGNIIDYYWDGTDYPYYETANKITGKLSSSHSTGFDCYSKLEGWKLFNRSNTATDVQREKITTLECNYYYYYPKTLTSSSSGITVGLDEKSQLYKILFINSESGAFQSQENNSDGLSYWISSKISYLNSGTASFGIFNVYSAHITGSSMYTSNLNANTFHRGIRPVVELNSEIILIDSGTDKNDCTLWNIE